MLLRLRDRHSEPGDILATHLPRLELEDLLVFYATIIHMRKSDRENPSVDDGRSRIGALHLFNALDASKEFFD